MNSELHVHVKEPLWSTQVAPLRHGLLAQALPVMTTAVKDGAATTPATTPAPATACGN